MSGLLITLGLGVFVIAGAAIAGIAKNEQRITDLSIAVALGAIGVLLVFDLVPEVFEGVEELGWPLTAVGIVAGFLVLAILDRFLPESKPAHCTNPEHHHHHESAVHISVATAIALTIHNVIEGMSVFSVASQSVTAALLLAFGIGIHNVPMGMIVYSGVRRQTPFRRYTLIGIAALSTFMGGLVMLGLGSSIDDRVVHFMIAVTVGLLAYIAFCELVPKAVRTRDASLTVIGIAVGAAIVFVGVFLAGMSGGHGH